MEITCPHQPGSALLGTSHCVLHRNNSLSMLACVLNVTRKGGAGGGGWFHLQSAGTWWLVGLAVKLSYMIGTG